MDRIVGIDPGLDGGLCCLERAMAWKPCFRVMPTLGTGRRELDLFALVDWLKRSRPDSVLIEAQQAMPKQGVSSCFTIGKNFGVLIGACNALGFSVQVVRPQRWQGTMLTGAPRTAGTKRAAEIVAQRLWPLTDWRATPRCKRNHDGLIDSALIAEYGRRVLGDLT
jgi:hypothetical protein